MGSAHANFLSLQKKKWGGGRYKTKKLHVGQIMVYSTITQLALALSLSLSLSHRVVDRTSAQNVRQLFILFDRPVLHSTRLHYFTKAKLHVKQIMSTTLKAVCVLKGDSNVTGTVQFSQEVKIFFKMFGNRLSRICSKET